MTSLLLEKDFFVSMPALVKIPFYGLFGVTMSFVIIFSVIDVINFVAGFFQFEKQKSVVDTHTQVRTHSDYPPHSSNARHIIP